ncbi:hypothetical protein [Haladaptatus sp. GCM10025893]|uniref:hypothetical protein n=1 Tax=Haladaptatus sp. GCM10025893 TaxID=3252659 RepID=UPI0036144EF2
MAVHRQHAEQAAENEKDDDADTESGRRLFDLFSRLWGGSHTTDFHVNRLRCECWKT